jgi:ribonuclease HII
MIVGIDEVGRGCWAGPLVAAAVALGEPIEGLRDSKKLSSKRRNVLAAQIHATSLGVGIGWVTPEEVDTLGLTKAVQLAMLRAMKLVDCDYDEIIIDGNMNFFQNVTGLKTSNIQTLVRADDLIPAVSAASIVAKVARDTRMTELAVEYPGYGFESHVGYGTAVHAAALKKLGVCDIHRKSYKPIMKLLA